MSLECILSDFASLQENYFLYLKVSEMNSKIQIDS